MDLWSIYVDHARLVNTFLLIGIIAAMTINMVVRWRIMNRRTRRVLAWIYLIFCNFVYGYIIAIRAHYAFNLSVMIASVLLSGLLVALLWNPQGDDQRLFEDDSLGTKFLRWLDNHVRRHKARRNKEG